MPERGEETGGEGGESIVGGGWEREAREAREGRETTREVGVVDFLVDPMRVLVVS